MSARAVDTVPTAIRSGTVSCGRRVRGPIRPDGLETQPGRERPLVDESWSEVGGSRSGVAHAPAASNLTVAVCSRRCARQETPRGAPAAMLPVSNNMRLRTRAAHRWSVPHHRTPATSDEGERCSRHFVPPPRSPILVVTRSQPRRRDAGTYVPAPLSLLDLARAPAHRPARVTRCHGATDCRPSSRGDRACGTSARGSGGARDGSVSSPPG